MPAYRSTVAESVVVSLYVYGHSNRLATVLLPVCRYLSSTPTDLLNNFLLDYPASLFYIL